MGYIRSQPPRSGTNGLSHRDQRQRSAEKMSGERTFLMIRKRLEKEVENDCRKGLASHPGHLKFTWILHGFLCLNYIYMRHKYDNSCIREKIITERKHAAITYLQY